MNSLFPATARTLAVALVAAFTLLAPCLASAQTVLVESDFNRPPEFDDDWLTGNVQLGLALEPAPTISLGLLDKGLLFIESVTSGSPATGWIAPAKFLGDQRAAMGGWLRFDLSAVGGSVGNDSVRLSDGVLELYFRVQPPDSDDFHDLTSYSLPLDSGVGWWTAGATPFVPRTPTTSAEMLQVLGNLQSLAIRADYFPSGNPINIAVLDNVRLISAVPEPGSGLMLAAGLLALGRAAAKRRRA